MASLLCRLYCFMVGISTTATIESALFPLQNTIFVSMLEDRHNTWLASERQTFSSLLRSMSLTKRPLTFTKILGTEVWAKDKCWCKREFLGCWLNHPSSQKNSLFPEAITGTQRHTSLMVEQIYAKLNFTVWN